MINTTLCVIFIIHILYYESGISGCDFWHWLDWIPYSEDVSPHSPIAVVGGIFTHKQSLAEQKHQLQRQFHLINKLHIE